VEPGSLGIENLSGEEIREKVRDARIKAIRLASA